LVSANKYDNGVTKKKTILICDDERDILLFFETVLKSKYDVISVASGEECIDKYVEETNRGHKIHLILLDYRLGDMLGDSIACKIKSYNGTNVILISSYDLDYQLIKDLEERNYIRKYVRKPIGMNDLLKLVTEII
jgi:response regulator RpfG family c-di-GMP phosphodiesterase